MQPEGHKNQEEMLKVDKIQTSRQFTGDESRSKSPQRAKTILKNALNRKNTLARPPIYNGAYPEKLWTASPANSVGVTKLSSFLLLVQLDEISLEESTSLEENYFLTILRQLIHEKKSLGVKT